MNKRIYIITLISFVLLHFNHVAAQIAISGAIIDTTLEQNSQNIHFSISSETNHQTIFQGHTNADGSFKISLPATGNYVLLVDSFLYKNYKKTISVKNQGQCIDSFFLATLSIELSEVTIKDRPKISIKGDTISFAADSFKIGYGANLYTLLMSLPGLEIDKSGAIKMSGQIINQVNIDGRPFSTQNTLSFLESLKAADVDVVETYKDRSVKDKETGIINPTPTNTLNLVLKEEARTQFFGTSDLSFGTPSLYDVGFNSNLFLKEYKASSWIKVNNSNNIFGRSGIANAIQNTNADKFTGTSNQVKGGLHWDNQTSVNRKLIYSIDYSPGVENNKNDATQKTTSYTDNNVLTSEGGNSTKNNKILHQANLSATYSINETSTINTNINGYFGVLKSENSVKNAMSNEQFLINEQKTLSDISNNDKNLSYNIMFNKRIGTNGQSLSANFYNYKSTLAATENILNYYYLNQSDSTNLNNQNRLTDNTTNNNNLTISYQRPISKKISATISYLFQNQISKINSRTFTQYEASNGEKMDTLNPLFSSFYKQTILKNKISTGITLRETKYSINLGVAFGINQNAQLNFYSANKTKKTFHEIAPTFGLSWQISNNSNLNFNYFGQQNQPSLSQIQPVITNNNPFNVIIGNPILQPEFLHSINVDYNWLNIKKGNYLNANFNTSITQNAIVLNQYIDENGKTINRYENTNVVTSYSSTLNYNFAFFNNIKLNISNSFLSNSFSNTINGVQNTNRNYSINPKLNLGYTIDTMFYLQYRSGVIHNTITSNVSSSGSNNYLQFEQNLDCGIKLRKFTLGSSIYLKSLQKQTPESGFENMIYWNANITYPLNLQRTMLVYLTAFNLTNRKNFLSRTESRNMIFETNNTYMGRSILLSFVWNFVQKI